MKLNPDLSRMICYGNQGQPLKDKKAPFLLSLVPKVELRRNHTAID